MGSAVVQPQQRLGRYELLARLASGGMGEIFLARMEGAAGFEKLFVVKRVLPHLADDGRFRQMLISEARIASKLAHANICQVYELGETDGQLYIVMEYLEGITLLPLLRRASRDAAPLDLGFIAGIMQQATDALHYAHELHDRDGSSLGIVHRDVTPGNVFLTESGVVKVLDFGIAKAKGASSANTQTGAVKGKYAYMAPEQLRGAEIDRRVDVFALGIALYEMLALRRLFQRKTDYLTFRAVMEQPMPDVRHYRPDTPDSIAAVVVKALDRDPANRFDTARQMATALLDALAGEGKRPWSQGELGDYVRSNFHDDIHKRSYQVATAIQRTQPGSARTTMPLLVNPDAPPEPEDDDDDTEFPPVETAIDPAPPHAMTPGASGSMDFGGTTPPPFGLDSTSSGTSLQAIHAAAAARPPRSLLWPLVAIGMFVVAGGALVLVWKTSQQQAAPTSVVISTPGDTHVDDQNRIVVAPPKPDGVGSAVGAAVGSSSAGSGSVIAKPVPKPRARSPYDQVIESRVSQLNACMHDHPEPTLPTSAQLHIDTAGKPTSVTLQPATLNGTPLGGCLRNVLETAKFPSSPDEHDMTFPFHAK